MTKPQKTNFALMSLLYNIIFKKWVTGGAFMATLKSGKQLEKKNTEYQLQDFY